MGSAPHHSANKLRANSVPGLTDITVRTLPEGLHLNARLPSFGVRVGKKTLWAIGVGFSSSSFDQVCGVLDDRAQKE